VLRIYLAQKVVIMPKDVFLSVVAPVYNEEENIENVLRYWKEVLDSAGFCSEIVVTNDGSTDNTAGILAKLQEEMPRLKVVTLEQNGGYGKALTTSIQASRGEWVVTLDSDGQFDLKEYRGLLSKAQAEGLDGVTGYRGRKEDTRFRVFADRVLNLIVRTMFKVSFRDTNCALKLINGDFIRRANIEARGYPAPTELTIKLCKLGARIGEMGITHIERQGGLSKLNPLGVSIGFLKFLFYLRLKIYLYDKRIVHSL